MTFVQIGEFNGDEAETWHTCLGYRLYISCFYSDRIRTLVAMATFSSHRLMMGKEEIGIILSHWGYLGFIFYRNAY